MPVGDGRYRADGRRHERVRTALKEKDFYRDVEDRLEALVYASNDNTHRRYRTCGLQSRPHVSTDMRTRVRTRVRRTPLESSR